MQVKIGSALRSKENLKKKISLQHIKGNEVTNTTFKLFHVYVVRL